MRKFSIGLAFLVTALFFVALSTKAEEIDREKPLLLENMTVTDEEFTEPYISPYALSESSRLQIEVFTQVEIEALHPLDTWDLIQQAAAMEVTFQGKQHLDGGNMRGQRFSIILDGIYLSQTDRFLKSLPTNIIESMTVVRDSASLTLGPANKGFIIIKTKRASKLEGGFIGSYGSFNTEEEHIYQGMKIDTKIGSFDYRIAGTYNESDGKKNWNNGSRTSSFFFRGGYTTPVFNGDISYYYSDGFREIQRGRIMIPKSLDDGTLDWSKVGTLTTSTSRKNMRLSMIAVNLNKPWSNAQTTTFQYAYDDIRVDDNNDSHQDSYGQNVSLRHIIESRNNVLKIGGQWIKYICPQGQAPRRGKRVDESTYSLFLQDEYRMLDDRLSVDGGIRADKMYYNNSPLTGVPVDEWAEPTYAYGFGASYRFNAMFDLNGRYGYSENSLAKYQASADGSSLPNEKQTRYEVGINANIHASIKPWATLFYYDTKDQKVNGEGIDPNTGETVSSYIDPVTGDEIRFVTASDVCTKGIEFGISGKIFKPLTYSFSYSYKTADDDDVNAGMSQKLWTARLKYNYKRFFANVSANYAGPKDRNPYGGSRGVYYYEVGDYTRVDANIGYECEIFDRDTRITVYGRNLGDSHYATRYVGGAFEDVGFRYGAEVSYSFF